MNTKKMVGIAIAALITLASAGSTHALRPPHDQTSGNNITCGSCHKVGAKIRGYQPFCISECHNTVSSSNAKRKPLDLQFASNRFGTFTNLAGKKQFSHAWATLPNYSAANKNNKNAGANKLISVNQVTLKGVSGTNTIICSKCHYAHGTTDSSMASLNSDSDPNNNVNKPFVRVSTKGDHICFQCHEARDINSVRSDMQSAVIAGSKHYSHPVQVSYSGAKYRKSQEKDSEGANLKWEDWFEASPTNEPGWNESARPRLYTSYDGTKKDAVVCSTCHGPMHSADSNPYTLDNITSFSKGIYTTSAGNLLRRYPMSNATWGDKTCTACHKVKTHQGYQCNRCHEPHKRKGDNNIYLIRTSIQTPYAKQSVYFTSTSQMAKRWGIYSSPNSYRSTAICQVCHRTKSHHRAYSTAGADREHKYLGNNKFQNCILCHPHNAAAGGFAQTGGCSTCHDAPPSDNGNTWGKHAKHVGNAGYKWMPTPPTVENTLNDTRSATDYGFSCGRCHNAWTPYTASANGKNHYGTVPGSLKNFTADIGFGKGTHPLPTNSTNAGYNYGATGGIDDGMSSGDVYTWRYPGTAGTDGQCRNLYCHGQFYNGYTSNNPTWRGTQTCGACHGAKRSTPPGNTGGSSNNWGAHPRHVGNADSQQYNFSGWKFGCNACHYPTTMSSITSIDDRSTHVDGRATVEFNGGGYGDANSRYDGFVDYTSRKPQFFTKPAYKTCGLIYCHSDGSRTQGNYSTPFNANIGTGSGKYPNWSSIKNFTTTLNVGGKTFKRRCSRCHGNSTYVGITAAMPGVTSKGNSHTKHVIENGFLCNVCHDDTVNSDNKSIKSTTMHVNKNWDIKILSKYETSPGASSYSAGICNNVNCHGGQPTPIWGNSATCQNCHMNTTGDVDKRILPRSKFSEWTGAVPKIYSTQWAQKGHGPYRGCDKCHKAAVKHGTNTNPFRLFTASDRPNIICESCHGVGASNPDQGAKTGFQTHASSITGGGAGHNYAIKCVDCHDPHGDNNLFMIHSTLPRPQSIAGKEVASGRYGILTSTRTEMNVDFVNNVYTSDYAKKTPAPKVCQVCHDETKNPDDSNSRFRYNGTADTPHGSGRCIDCHQHSSGFKGAGCSGCHGNPPTGTFNLLSGPGRINNIKKRASGNSATYGAHTTHVSVFKAAGLSATQACAACHYSGMWGSGSENKNIDLEFRAFTIYSGTNQEFNSGLGTKTGFYGLSGIGVGAGTDNRCQNMKCHGGGNWLTASYGTPTAPMWENTSNTAKCGKCHGAKKAAGSGSWPTSKAHARHAGTGSAEYNLMCKLCHNQTVLGTATTLNKGVHVNAQANIAFDTADLRVSGSTTYSGDTNVNSGFGKCATIYCHSRGTDFNTPYTYANYTADWTETLAGKWPTNTGERCSYCHGSKGAGGYKGITSAMPNYPNLSPKINGHKKHVVDNGFSCYACHAATVDSTGRAIANKANHLNRVYDVSFPFKYDLGGAAYTFNKCTNIKCHGGRTTPAWGGGVAANCQDCHYASSGAASAEDSFTWENMSGTAAKIYSSEWTKRGHGASGAGKYPFSNNNKAGKNCAACHDSGVSHNTGGNYFRLTNLDPEILCLSCHGSGGQLTGAYGNATGIQSHSWANISTAGYKTGNTDGKAGWNFLNQTAKCVDCHDPHGDKNNYMVHSFVNMSGSDSQGRPLAPYAQDSVLMNFTAAKNGTQVAWSSFVKSDRSGICQRCHSAEVANFDKGASGFTAHNAGTRCTDCHKHKKGFAPAGCTSCHGDDTRLYERSKYAPPKAPSAFGWTSDDPGNQATWGIHQPHAYNPRNRPGFNNQTGFACSICHGPVDGRSEAGHPGSTNNAGMNNMTSSATAPSKRSKWAPGADGKTSVIDDTCWNTGCHTPRAYTRTWKKPVDCDDCHGYQQKTATVYATHTTQSHKIHVRYTSSVGYKKKYGFACKNCHYDWVTNNNYSTHYNSFVNITANGPVNTVGGAFYQPRGRSFKGFTTGNESLGTCSNTYCHGNFTGGVNGTPNWKKGVTTVNCASCHRSAYVDATGMPGKHPKHASTSKGGYQFACVRCHSWTTNNITTVLFNRTSHVNTRKDVNFNTQPVDQTAGTYPDGATSKRCENIYCHSKGTSSSTPFTGAHYSNFTAKWGDTVGGYKVAAGSKGRCNYCHGNDTWTGTTSAMPNYVNTTPKANRHDKHVRTYNFVCNVCHYKVTNNNTSIEVSGGRALHVNGSYNVNFRQGVGSKAYINNTGIYTYITGTPGSKCKNTYCHSMGTDWTKPYSTRTSFSNFTARWGDTLGSYKQTRGLKAKCNYCHGSRAYSGQTSAMPNYSTEKGKANSHRAHVLGNGYMCNICHYGVVRNNTSISDAARHADRFYNISLAPGYRGAAGKTYSTSWSPQVGGTCMNNTCHGSSKPKWGVPSTASCKSCHFTTNATEREDDYGRFNSVAAKIYSTDWGKKGHGAWNRTCNNCHDSNVAHNFAQTPLSNPFRLYTSDPNALCQACHGNTTERADNWGGGLPDASTGINIKTHNKADATGGIAASWNNFQNNKVKCVDCHDPHGDKNKRMIQSFINHTGSDRFGRPTRADFSTVSSAYSAQMTFTSFGGNINWSSFANANVNNSICRRCHTPNPPDTGMGDQANALMTKTQYAGGSQHQASHQACTGCHDHKAGFKGGGESSGGQDCLGCHGALFNSMTSQSTYHHAMYGTAATYPSSTAPTQTDAARRCLLCHVDHNIFRGDAGFNVGVGARARNLRQDSTNTAIGTGDSTDLINTDFWPAKRNGKYATDPVDGAAGKNGVCMSCHDSQDQTKNVTRRRNDGSQKAKGFSKYMFYSSSHNFQIISGMNNFTKDNSSFRANCVKCHRSWDVDKGSAQSGEKFGLHDSRNQSLLNYGNGNGDPAKPQIETLCYKCHGADSADSARGSYDYYSSINMSTTSKLIKTAIVAKRSGHPIESIGASGDHDPYEYSTAAAGWNSVAGTRHVECTDCHNTHGGNAGKVRNAGRSDGNKVSGAQTGVWGLTVTFGTIGTNPTYVKKESVTYQYELCLKCHSNFGFGGAGTGNDGPGVPSGLPDPVLTPLTVDTWYESLDPTISQSNIGALINPANYGYHPVAAVGKNQPADGLNGSWPAAGTRQKYVNVFGQTTSTPRYGLDWAFVPPWGKSSTMACSDCHQADNTGKGIMRFKPESVTSAGSWTGATLANIVTPEDGLFAQTNVGSDPMEINVTGGSAANAPDELWVVVYGSTTLTGVNTKKQSVAVLKSGVGVTGSPVTVPLPTSISRVDKQLAGWTEAGGWTSIENDYTVRITSNATAAAPVKVDYLGLEAVYPAPGDLRGPHGSLQKWILADIDLNINFDANNDGDLIDAGDKPNLLKTAQWQKNIFCWNCHRSDVYDNLVTGAALYSRFKHGAENLTIDGTRTNVWGIVCMNCHGGGAKGEIHGSWADNISKWGSFNLNRPRGVRLLNGALFNAQISSNLIGCYVNSPGDEFANDCVGQHAAPKTYAPNYQYQETSW